jgi:flagellar hook-associated protein 3 FlgL
MISRTTAATSSRMMLADLSLARQALTDAQGRISSGKAIERASDGPADALVAIDHRASLARSAQYDRNATDASGWLNTADTALVGAVDNLNRARELVLMARNSSGDPGVRAAASAELRSIRQSLLQLSNTAYLGRPIFAGNVAGTAAYSSSGTYVGDAGAVRRPVAEGVDLQVNQTGPAVFGASSATPMDGDLFQMLDAVATAIDAGDVAAMGTSLDRIDTATSRIEDTQVTLGARARQLEDVTARAASADIDRRQALSQLEDVDMAEALIRVRGRQFSYEAALGIAGRTMSTSLLDYLR